MRQAHPHNLRFIALAMDLPSDVLAYAGGRRRRGSGAADLVGEGVRTRGIRGPAPDLLEAVVVLVEDAGRFLMSSWSSSRRSGQAMSQSTYVRMTPTSGDAEGIQRLMAESTLP